jgi:hypothetical protein
MDERCTVVNIYDQRRCERDAGHDGAHMVGLGPGLNLIMAWPVVKQEA